MAEERAAEFVERIFWTTFRGCFDYSVNPAQWAALRFFADPHIDKKTSAKFAKFHQTTRGTANQTVLALIRKGYLKRDVSPSDHRSKSISVTQSGMEALKRQQRQRQEIGDQYNNEVIELLQAMLGAREPAHGADSRFSNPGRIKEGRAGTSVLRIWIIRRKPSMCSRNSPRLSIFPGALHEPEQNHPRHFGGSVCRKSRYH